MKLSKSLWTLLAALMVLPAAGAWAQAGAAAAAPGGKIGIVNLQNAILSTAEGKDASAKMQSQFAPEQNQIQALQKEVSDLQNQFNAGQRTLSADEQSRIQREGEQKAREMQRREDNLNEEVQNANQDLVDGIGRKMMDVVDRYARENGYSLVLNSSATGTPVIWGSPQSDITSDIVRAYDQEHPVKTSSAAPATPAKPAPAGAPSGAAAPKTPAPAK